MTFQNQGYNVYKVVSTIKARAFCEEQEWSVEYTNELVHGLREHSLDKIINLRGDS